MAEQTSLTAHISNTSNPHSVTKTQVGLGNVDNTSGANKPISTATQNALDAKQTTLVSGTNIKTINGTSVLGSGDLTIAGGGGDSFYPKTPVGRWILPFAAGYVTNQTPQSVGYAPIQVFHETTINELGINVEPTISVFYTVRVIFY